MTKNGTKGFHDQAVNSKPKHTGPLQEDTRMPTVDGGEGRKSYDRAFPWMKPQK